MKIKDDVLNVLIQSRVNEEENILYLPDVQLERNLYVNVNKCLESIGGRWNRKVKGHVFDHNPSDDLDEMVNTGEWTDEKKLYQFFATPKNIVNKMIELAEIESADILLEPSAGQGAILEEFDPNNIYIAFELMEKNCEILRNKGFAVYQGDFLDQYYLSVNKVIMNPPFSRGQDVEHIFHAWDALTAGGRLVSIVSESPFFRTNKTGIDFRNWIKENKVEVINLDVGTFKESGTMVKTRMIVADKN